MVNIPEKRTVQRTVGNGNLYQRLEKARKQRAKVLATPKPANDAGPLETPKVKAPPQAASKESLPTLQLKNPIQVPVAKPERNRFAYWPLAVAIALLALLSFVYTSPPQPLPLVQDKTQVLPAPNEAASATTTVSPGDAQPFQIPRPSALAGDTPNALPTIYGTLKKPVVSTVVPPLELTASLSSLPRFAAIGSAPPANVSALLEPLRDATFELAPENTLANLQIALHVPSFTPRGKLRNLIADAETAGLDIGDPTFVDFPIKSTQVRYFHRNDQDAAALLAATVGGISRDFTDFSPQPPAGFVEVWVSGAPRPTTPERRAGLFDNLGRDLRQLGSDMRGALQSITR